MRQELFYISGPMTGIPEFNYPAFIKAGEVLKGEGKLFLSPVDCTVFDGITYWDYLRSGMDQLVKCTDILLLPGWSSSQGANLEVFLGIKLGLSFHLYDDEIYWNLPRSVVKEQMDMELVYL